MKALIVPISFLSLSLFGMQFKSSDKAMEIYHDGQEFSVVHKNNIHKIKPIWLDSDLRNATMSQLLALQRNGYITVNRMINGDLTLRSHLKLRGGGPILGGVFYVVTKGVLWGGLGLVTALGVKKAVEHAGNTSNRVMNETAAHTMNAAMRSGLGCTGDVSLTAGLTQKVLEEALIDHRGEAASAIIATSAPHIVAAGGVTAFIEAMAQGAYQVGLAIPWI